MKQFSLKSLGLLLMLCISQFASAYDFKVDGVYYNIHNNEYWDGQQNVTEYRVYVAPMVGDGSPSNAAAYSGDVVIPESVIHEGTNYSVSGIESYTFYACDGLTSVSFPATIQDIGYYIFGKCSGLQSITMPSSMANVYDQTQEPLQFLEFNTTPLLTNVSQLSSNASDSAEGQNIEYLIDDDISTYWHSDWHGVCQDQYHYLQVALTKEFTGDIVIAMTRRNCDNDHPTEMLVQGSLDGKSFKDITTVSLPFYGSGTLTTSYPFRVNDSVKYLRFNTTNCTGKSTGYRIFWHAVEFQLYGMSHEDALEYNNYRINVPLNVYGTCGDNLTWFLNGKTGELAITGTGDMEYTTVPWRSIRTSIQKVIINEGVTSIGPNAFQDCTNLTSVTIPNSVTSIGDYAFSGCSSLTSISIPEGVTSIGRMAFFSCNSLPEIDGIRYADTYLLKIADNSRTTYTIKEGTKFIGNNAFVDYIGTTDITIPESVISIEENAFNSQYISKVNLASSTPPTIASTNCFYSDALILVPDAAIATYKTAEVWSEIANRIIPQGQFQKNVDIVALKNGSALLDAIGGTSNTDNIISLKISGTMNGYDIMIIRNKLKSLRYLDLSDVSIVANDEGYEYYSGCHTEENVLGARCFCDLDNLRSIVLPKNITSIGDYAMAGCGELTDVTGMPVTCKRIGNNAFNGYPYNSGGYSGLTHITIGEGVEEIGDEAFFCCTNLKEIRIPSSVKRIGRRSFYMDWTLGTSLQSIHFSEGLETIGNGAFEYCSQLKELRLPSSLKRIEYAAFNGCSGLQEVHISSMLEYVGDNAFTGCGLQAVYAYAVNPNKIEQNSFNYNGVKLYAPRQSFWEYYLNTQWSQFMNPEPFDAEYTQWYIGENTDTEIDTEESNIPNADDENPADGEIRQGGGLIFEGDGIQKIGKLILKWLQGGNYPSLIDNGKVDVKEMEFSLNIQAHRWYFFSFPFEINLSDVTCQGKSVWRYYDSAQRAQYGNGGWKNVNNGKLEAGKGYIFQCDTQGEVIVKVNAPTLNNTGKKITLEVQASANVQDASWNFVGNPDLCYYDLGDLAAKYDAPITVWNTDNNTYEALMPGDDDYELHPFQAFFVQKPEGKSSVDFEAANRLTNNKAQKRQKARRKARAEMPIDKNRMLVNLTLSNGNMTDKTRVVFNEAKSAEYETACDASKFMSTENVPQIYTTDAKQVKYAINERPMANGQVNVGYSVQQAGRYTLGAPRMDCAMLLKDNLTGTIHDLTTGDYEFESEAGNFDSRFILMLKSATSVEDIESDLSITTTEGGIMIEGLTGTAQVYNAAGQQIQTITDNGRVSVPAGVYVVTAGKKSVKVSVK